jgi:hypothetical protein
MHPQAFLKTFWRMELRPQVFVAMSFSPQYQPRFDSVIRPAIEGIKLGGQSLKAFRVDISKTGDSILTDIVDGIAHSQLVLADVSTIGKDAVTGIPYRNGNVMYEVGLALACRHPSEVLLVRDDDDKFLFDVSSVPHKRINFVNVSGAAAELQEELLARLREQQHVQDIRVQLAIAGLSKEEAGVLKSIADYPPTAAWGHRKSNLGTMTAYPRLLEKEIIRLVAQFEEGHPAYVLTPLGRVVAKHVATSLRRLKSDSKLDKATEGASQTT